MACDNLALLHCYHDGELSPEQRRSVEAHLHKCVECREMLAQLDRLSETIVQASLAEPSVGMLRRLAESRNAVRDRGVLRAAGWLTAASAAVLVGALLSWPPNRAEMSAQPAVWETVAVMPPAHIQEEGASRQLVMAQWMADELASGERQ